MKHRLLPLLLALVLCTAAFTACSPQEESYGGDAVNRVYPEGEGRYYQATPSEVASTEFTAAASLSTQPSSQPTTKSKTPGTSASTATPSSTVPATTQAGIPRDNVGSGNINPNIGGIQSDMAAQIDALPVRSISLSETSLTLEVGESKEIEIYFNPSDAANKTCTLVSDNGNFRVSALGRTVTVTGNKAGTGTLTVISHNDHRATCDITVKHSEQDEITDDTSLPHRELVTVENAERWTDAIIDRLETLGMTRNTGLQGESFRVTTDDLTNMSFNEAAVDLAAQADYLATNMSNGEYYDYDFNCVCLAQGNGEFYYVVALRQR